MELTRFYAWKRLETSHVRAIRDVLGKTFNWEFAYAQYSFCYSDFIYTVDKIVDADNIVLSHGQPMNVHIVLRSQGGRKVSLETRVGNHISLAADNKDEPPERILDALEPVLGLQKITHVSNQPPSSAFIAHVFDDDGQNSASELSYFLSLIGVRCQSGRGFSPGRVSDKVRGRLEAHHLFFAIVTPHQNPTWITQEISTAATLKKPLFILKHSSVELNAGILGDHEYIQFDSGMLSRTFVRILEGIKEVSRSRSEGQLWAQPGPPTPN
jgi:hypothetical protein